jgi:hypothetical protein
VPATSTVLQSTVALTASSASALTVRGAVQQPSLVQVNDCEKPLVVVSQVASTWNSYAVQLLRPVITSSLLTRPGKLVHAPPPTGRYCTLKVGVPTALQPRVDDPSPSLVAVRL